jgi:hypothetical protein
MGLEDMTGTMRRVLGAFVMTLAVLPFVAYQGVAQAADSTVTVDIGAGNNAEKVGTATITLSTTTLTVDSMYNEGVTLKESQLCIDDAAFTERIEPGQCDYKNATGDFSVPLAGLTDWDGNLLTGNTVCVQIHYALTTSVDENESQTAYASHVPGKPFFGNVCLQRPTTPPPPPGDGGGGGTTSAPVSSPATASSSAPASVEGTSEAAETDVAVEGTKSGGELAATGGSMSLGTALAIGFGLLLAGAALMTLPRHLVAARGAHRRRH